MPTLAAAPSALLSVLSSATTNSGSGYSATVVFRQQPTAGGSTGSAFDRNSNKRKSSVFSSDSARKKWRDLERKVIIYYYVAHDLNTCHVDVHLSALIIIVSEDIYAHIHRKVFHIHVQNFKESACFHSAHFSPFAASTVCMQILLKGVLNYLISASKFQFSNLID